MRCSGPSITRATWRGTTFQRRLARVPRATDSSAWPRAMPRARWGCFVQPWPRTRGRASARRWRCGSGRSRSGAAHAVGDDAFGDAEIERRAELAADALATGDAAAARAELEAVLALSPGALRPLVMLSELHLTQNRKADAAAVAQRAIAAHPDSVARMSPRRKLRRRRSTSTPPVASSMPPSRSTPPTCGRSSIARASVLAPAIRTERARTPIALRRALPLTRSCGRCSDSSGWPKATKQAARADFDAAASSDPALGEPHLGLGLLHFRAGCTTRACSKC